MSQDWRTNPIAHLTKDGAVQPLIEHLEGTAERAREMAAEFGSGEWGYLAGLWHDLGKYSAEFQRYIRDANDPDAHIEGRKGRVDHSTAGAILACDRLDGPGTIFAYLIAGHHAGLPDYEADRTGNAALSQRLQRHELVDAALNGNVPVEILNRPLPKERPASSADPAFWIRLLYSCLADADFLDTEHFLDSAKATSRGQYAEPEALLKQFQQYMHKKERDAPETPVNRIRAEVLHQCIDKASESPGIYTLNVPTGGGKTLSSMAFALHHAVKYGKRRIIYVIPYTSIIEQNAEQFRVIFGDAVIEHQSNLDVSDPAKDNSRSRLACENWDVPVVVTTSVQFFESLFASRTSRCRKLHNIINSVVILDEAQLLPPEFLNPILQVLAELQRNYGVTLLLSTATQPALGSHKTLDFNFAGLPEMREIIKDPTELHNRLKRVEIELPKDMNHPTDWDALASELKKLPSVLCIVNRRDDCRALWEKMPADTFHLSGLMCGAHRSAKIGIIKERLKHGVPTRVISTQLVEAGVDVDFPVVYRAVAGLDSIAQAAGRCNREGLLPNKGRFVVFVPPSNIPGGHLRQAAQIGKRLLSEDCADILAPDRFAKFFREFYWIQGANLDKHSILDDLRMDSHFRCSFRSAAEKFHIIDDAAQAPVIVPYGDGPDLIRILEQGKPERWLLRRLQRHVVNLPRQLHSRLCDDGFIKEPHPGIYILTRQSMYDNDLGFCADRAKIEPDELVV